MKASAGGHHVCPAFVLGTRRGDPNCGDQQAFSPSSDWMPGSNSLSLFYSRFRIMTGEVRGLLFTRFLVLLLSLFFTLV